MRDKLTMALALGYENIYSVNLNTGLVNCYKMGQFISEKYGERFKDGQYHEHIGYYIANEVYEEDRKLFDPILNVEKVKVIFENEQSYTINYRVLRKGEMHYYQCRLAKPVEIEEIFAIGFKNVDDEMIENLKQKELLRSALAAAKHGEKTKNRFLSNMSHDIRTPLNAIIGYTTLAKNHSDNKELVEDYMSKIQNSSKQLLALVNEVLEMSRIESGANSLHEKEENLKQVIDELVSIALANVNSKKLDFSMNTSCIADELVYLDKLKFIQIFINILSNAIKYTNPGGKLSFEVAKLDNAWDGYLSYEFVVKDNGIGMSEQFIQKVFDPFERENNSTICGVQGTGLGMSITKNIVDQMCGTISVESEKNNGTTVVVRLQFKKVLFANEQNPARKVNFSGRRILVVEDNELNREIDIKLLEDEGFVVDTANNGLEAYEKLASSTPGNYEIILMDVHMPVMDGFEATKRIRALEEPLLANIPILAITTNEIDAERKKAIASGMQGCITKPIQLPKLLGTISELLYKEQ